MGGIGAHCIEDFRTLQMFVEAPSMYKETFKLHCVEKCFPDHGVRRPVEIVLFDFDETLTLATFMPSMSSFSRVDWDPGELSGTDWSAEELVLYSFESPFSEGCRLALLRAMLQDISKRHILAVLSKNESGAAAVLNLLKLAGLAKYFSAIWTTPYRSLVPCAVYQASPGQWEVFEPPLMDIQDHQTEVLYHIVEHTDKWFPQIGLKQDRYIRLQPLSPESVILVDDERENLQSPLGKQALRYCKVARYDEVYRSCGPLNQLGGIGAHSEEDFETLRAFIAEPWAFQEPRFEKEQGEEVADPQLELLAVSVYQ
ncbi:Ucp1 [Symbiodinium natans]|uniref:Ucp1 protein n=1 Tax=Symbiodinium natans TaxID=878477 RepID=A0A812SE36_9DINO|nr:Ucp1 [Symbiodinium natans]